MNVDEDTVKCSGGEQICLLRKKFTIRSLERWLTQACMVLIYDTGFNYHFKRLSSMCSMKLNQMISV